MSLPYDENTYHCRLLRVVDGDTLQIQVDLGLRVERNLYVRIGNINAPEIRGEEKELGKAASTFAQVLFDRMVAIGRPVLVKFGKGKSFDRWIGQIYVNLEDGSVLDFGAEMVKAGHATPA